MISLQVREAHVLQDLQRRLKKDKAEYEAAIQALKVWLFRLVISPDKEGIEVAISLIFAPKHILSLLIGIASISQFQ